jgi:hypothetical protein
MKVIFLIIIFLLLEMGNARSQWLMPIILTTKEDHGLKPVLANSLQDPILIKPITKKGWWSGSRYRP